MLEAQEELKPAFCNIETGNPKAIDCVRVDGASDAVLIKALAVTLYLSWC